MPRIEMKGGYIQQIGEWKSNTGEVLPYWKAHSNHTGDEIECYSRGLAEFFVWIVAQRFRDV